MGNDAHRSARTWALVWHALHNASLAATALLGSCCRTGPACHPATASATTKAACTGPGTSLHSILATTGAGGTGDGVWGFPPPSPLAYRTFLQHLCGRADGVQHRDLPR